MKQFSDTNQDVDDFYEIWKEQVVEREPVWNLVWDSLIYYFFFYFKQVDTESDIQGNDLVGERNL